MLTLTLADCGLQCGLYLHCRLYVCQPFFISFIHMPTIVFECLRWCINHRERVCILCVELFKSVNFFWKFVSENDDIVQTNRVKKPKQQAVSFSVAETTFLWVMRFAFGQFILSTTKAATDVVRSITVEHYINLIRLHYYN